MFSPSDGQYEAILRAIEDVRAMIEKLEAEPPSPKRDVSIELLRERLASAIGRLREIKSDNHHN